jgi:hypothetical protein
MIGKQEEREGEGEGGKEGGGGGGRGGEGGGRGGIERLGVLSSPGVALGSGVWRSLGARGAYK